MKKYWIILKNSFQTEITYRFNVLTIFIEAMLSFTVMLYIWFSIYRQGGQLGSYDLSGLILYFLFSRFLSLTITYSNVAYRIGEMIRQGDVVSYFLKPINFLRGEFIYNLGGVFFRTIVFTIIFLLIIFFGFKKIPFDLYIMGYFSVSIIISLSINFLFFYIIGISTFYFGFIMGLNFIAYGILELVSGRLIPLDLLPDYLYKIFNFLPFKHIIFVPISIITGKMQKAEILHEFMGGFIWLFVLYILAVYIFKYGSKKYEAYGG